jgi:hypothetical protein
VGRSRWIGLIAAIALTGVLVGVALNSEAGRIATGRWSFTQSQATDRGTYFRLQVNVAYKGEPVAFDIVVGCNVSRIGYKDGSSTVEVDMVPVVFGKRMPDNKGLVVRAPDACGTRYIKDGWIPDDLLPLMIVYDDADTLAFGTAYISEDAYRSPLSVLRFEWATITAATRSEFEIFRNQQTNLVGRDAFQSGRMGIELLRPLGLDYAVPFGSQCHAYQRFRIPEELREQVRTAWPIDRPRYWWPGHKPAFDLGSKPWQVEAGGEFRRFSQWGPRENLASSGVRRANGGGWIQPQANRSAPQPIAAYYPRLSDARSDKWPFKQEDWAEFARLNSPLLGERIDFQNGDTRGFAYCYLGGRGHPGSLTNEQLGEVQRAYYSTPVLRMIDNYPIAGAPQRLGSDLLIFIESDEFFFRRIQIFIEGTRSDV